MIRSAMYVLPTFVSVPVINSPRNGGAPYVPDRLNYHGFNWSSSSGWRPRGENLPRNYRARLLSRSTAEDRDSCDSSGLRRESSDEVVSNRQKTANGHSWHTNCEFAGQHTCY